MNSVDAVLCDEGRRGERTIVIAATDGGLQLAVLPTDPTEAVGESAAEGWAVERGPAGGSEASWN